MKISTKSLVLTSVVLLILFSAGLLCRSIALGREGIEPDRRVSEEKLMTGRDDPDSRYIELIPGQQVDINSADERSLQQLPGIGDTLSRRIIEHRESKGSFDSIEDIMLVEGIEQEDFNHIKDMISIGDENEDTGS